MRLGAGEIVLIILLILIVFGAGKLSGIGGAIGKSIKDFKHEVNEENKSGNQ